MGITEPSEEAMIAGIRCRKCGEVVSVWAVVRQPRLHARCPHCGEPLGCGGTIEYLLSLLAFWFLLFRDGGWWGVVLAFVLALILTILWLEYCVLRDRG